MFPIVNLRYPDGAPAVQCQADGSGVATYPSGRKAVCVLPHHQSRRFSCLVYARSEVPVRSAVPDEERPKQRPPHPDDAKRRRTRHLGALDDWGLGILEALDDGSGRGSYEVTATHVTVVNPGPAGGRTRLARAAPAAERTEVLSLRLSPDLMVTYDLATGTTSLDFSCGGVSYTFHIGEVWKLGSGSGLRVTRPLEVAEQIELASQKHLDSANCKMETTLKLQATLKNSTSCPSLPADKTLKKSHSEATMRLPLEHFQTLSQGRLDFKQEHQLKVLTGKVHPSLARPKIGKTMREGYMWPAAHPGKVPVDPIRIAPPLSLEKIASHEVEKHAGSLEAGQLLAVLVVASWSKQSNYSSSAHAEIVAQAAWSELKASGEDRLIFCLTDLSEAGAIYSSTKFENPLVVKYGVKEAPWLLLFARGELIFSENPHAPRSGGGLGFAARLRYKAFALPQVLIVEPAPNPSALQQQAAQVAMESNGRLNGTQNVVNNFQLQLQTQEVLKRGGYDYELAITSSDAMRLASCAQSPYGLLLCSSQVPASAITELTSRMRQRNPKVLAFLCHDAKQLGGLDEATQNLIDQQQVAGVIYRPITRSALQRALRGHPEANVQYPTCGMVKEDIVDLLKLKLGSL